MINCLIFVSLLVTSEVLRPIVHNLAVDDKYSSYKNENLQQAIQMQFSQKLKTFYQFFISFLKSTSNFQHVDQKDQVRG